MAKTPAQFTKEDNKALTEKLNLRKALNKEENRGLYTAKDREKLEKDIGKLYEKRNRFEVRLNEIKEEFTKKMKESGKLSKEGLNLNKEIEKAGKKIVVGAQDYSDVLKQQASIHKTEIGMQTDLGTILDGQLTNYNEIGEAQLTIGTNSFKIMLDMEKMQQLDEKVIEEKEIVDNLMGLEDPNDICSTSNMAIVNSTEFIQATDMGDDDDYNPGF